MARRNHFTHAWLDLIARISVWAGGERRRSVARSRVGGSGNILDGMVSREFESLLGEAFRLQGFQAAQSVGVGAGAGVDLVLRRDRQTHLVRCNSWRASKVGVDVVQQLHDAMVARGAAGGIIVTSGRFGREATAFAGGCNIRLIEGPALVEMIKQAEKARGAATPRTTLAH